MVPYHMWIAGTQLDPKHLFSCPSIFGDLFNIDNDCSRDILYLDRAMDVATAVIHAFDNIYLISLMFYYYTLCTLSYTTTTITTTTTKGVNDETCSPGLLGQIPSRPKFLSYGGHCSTPYLELTHVNLYLRSTLSLKYPLMEVVTTLCTYKSITKVLNPNHKSSLAGISFQEGSIGQSLCAVKERIPREKGKKHLPFSKEFLDLLKSERNAVRCRAKNTYNIADCIILRKAQAQLKTSIILSKITTYRSFAANLDFRQDGPRAYSFISHLNSEKASQHWEPIRINQKLLTSPTEVATAFSKNYAAITPGFTVPPKTEN
ncbi:hypothetical protein TNCV_3478371 [Trichonephila clavipes]|nr:hypothetical protein TNCV_3478371 [Trichonephila clavipes]